MRYHPVPIQFNEEEKLVGGKMTLRQLGFLAVGFVLSLIIPFFIIWLPWYLVLPFVGVVIYQTIKFTFFTKFGWAYFDYWVKLRRCKKRQNQFLYRKTVKVRD